jgi:glycosyltransferase involved in cell wall biosynthesis
VLLWGHAASGSGAPKVLLDFAASLRRERVDVRAVLTRGGPLTDAYRQTVPTTVVDGPLARRVQQLGELLAPTPTPDRVVDFLARAATRGPARRLHRAARTADVVWANTAAAVPYLVALPPEPAVVLHLHEMRYAIELVLAARSKGPSAVTQLRAALDRVTTVVVPSEAARADLVELVPEAGPITAVVHPGVDAGRTATDWEARRLRREIGIPAQAQVVVAAGTWEWRKGADLFVQIAAELARAGHQDVHFLWVGAAWAGEARTEQARRLTRELQDCGLGGRVHVVAPVADLTDHLGLADVFMLPSREDPFPLVAVEAAALGKPVVCFDSVGTGELVATGGGTVVPSLAVGAFATAVSTLLTDPTLRASTGAAARAAADGFTTEAMCDGMRAVLDRAWPSHG